MKKTLKEILIICGKISRVVHVEVTEGSFTGLHGGNFEFISLFVNKSLREYLDEFLEQLVVYVETNFWKNG